MDVGFFSAAHSDAIVSSTCIEKLQVRANQTVDGGYDLASSGSARPPSWVSSTPQDVLHDQEDEDVFLDCLHQVNENATYAQYACTTTPC
jgi:hypothetical protein